MRLNRSFVSRIILAILVIVSIAALFINKGFYYFELNNHVEVSITGDKNEVNNFISSINDSNLIRVDKINNIIYFENEAESDVRANLNQQNSENKVSLIYSTFFYERVDILRNYMLIVALTIISSTGLFIYFLLRNKSGINLRKTAYLITSYLVLAILSNLILSGILSIISRFYQVRELDLVSFLILNLWLSLIFSTALWRIDTDNFDSTSTLYASEEFYHKNYILITLFILVFVTLGLGLNFIVTAALILISIILISFNFYNIGSIVNFGFNIKRPQINFNRSLIPIFRRKNTAIEKSVSQPRVATSNKKNKQKKKKRK